MRGPRRVAIVLFILLLGAYLANGRNRESTDTLPARYLPFTILRHGTFLLDVVPRIPTPYFHAVRRTAGGTISDFPVGAALLALPIYAPFVLAGASIDGAWPRHLEKLAAAVIVAVSAVVLFLILRRLTEPTAALMLTLIYGLGTSNLSENAQGLWQHGPASLGLAAGIYCLIRGRQGDRRWLARAALPLAFAVIARPTTILSVVPLVAYALLLRPGIVRFAAWGLAPLAFHAWYSLTYFGVISRTQYPLLGGGLFTTPLPEGIYGVLLSPGRGLFIYSPIFLLSLGGAMLAWRRDGDGLLRALSVAIIPTVFVYARSVFWAGGSSYGPRQLGELNVALTLLLVPLVPWVRASRFRLAAASVLVVACVASHAYGAFFHTWERDATHFAERLWLWRRHPIIEAAWPPAPRRESAEPFLFAPHAFVSPGGRVHLQIARDKLAHDELLEVGLEADNTGGHPLDLYVGSMAPTYGVATFFPAPQRITTPVPLTRSEWFRRRGTVLPGAHVEEPRLLRFPMHQHLGPGSFVLFAALVEPGGTPWRVVASDVRQVHLRAESPSRDASTSPGALTGRPTTVTGEPEKPSAAGQGATGR